MPIIIMDDGKAKITSNTPESLTKTLESGNRINKPKRVTFSQGISGDLKTLELDPKIQTAINEIVMQTQALLEAQALTNKLLSHSH